MPYTLTVESQLAASWPPQQWRDVSVMVAISGGADSIALLRALFALKQGGAGELWAAHFNHRLRPAANDDELFVRGLCQAWSVPLKVGAAPSGQIASGDGVEADARRLRYDFLRNAAEAVGARWVVTAHTLDDHVETILHRIARGTGLEGLQGIPRTRPLSPAVTLMRPLLAVRHEELESYLRTHDQPWCEDETNREARFTRNRVRHQLLPLLEQISPGAANAIARLGQIAADAQDVIDDQVATWLQLAVRAEDGNLVTIDCAAIAVLPRHLVRELLVRVWRTQNWPLQGMGFEHWNLLAENVLAGGADRVLPGEIVAEREGPNLILRKRLNSEKPA